MTTKIHNSEKYRQDTYMRHSSDRNVISGESMTSLPDIGDVRNESAEAEGK